MGNINYHGAVGFGWECDKNTWESNIVKECDKEGNVKDLHIEGGHFIL